MSFECQPTHFICYFENVVVGQDRNLHLLLFKTQKQELEDTNL
jgi:hypothetical protein